MSIFRFIVAILLFIVGEIIGAISGWNWWLIPLGLFALFCVLLLAIPDECSTGTPKPETGGKR